VRYYENIRIVYDMESRVRMLRRTLTPAEPRAEKPATEKQKDHSNDTTQQPEQKQERNYSQAEQQVILADAPAGPSVVHPLNQDLPVVSVTTYRRFV